MAGLHVESGLREGWTSDSLMIRKSLNSRRQQIGQMLELRADLVV